jgi:hypothetical protein
MDISGWWAGLMAALPRDANEALALGQAVLANPWARTFALIVIVYLTIRVIAGIYSGDKQGAELGPVAIRQHTSARYGRDTVRMPHALMPMAMDGVSACCKIFYVYNDARGRRRKHLIHAIRDAKLSVSPVNLPRIRDVIYGQEIPEGVATRHVCFPPVDVQDVEGSVPGTPEMAADYVRQNKVLEAWTEDDSAVWISTSSDVKEEVHTEKINFIQSRARGIEKVERGFFNRMRFRPRYENRPNVVGSYYLKFEFSHEPIFVLTRHPDRDLKMTAWLTILTSMFALIMDWWPNGAPPFGIAASSEVARSAGDGASPVRSIRVPIP